MEMAITQQVVGAVACVLHKREDEIVIQAPFAELGADELDLFELVLKFEDVFGMEISDEDVTRLTCVQEVVTYVLEKRGGSMSV